MVRAVWDLESSGQIQLHHMSSLGLAIYSTYGAENRLSHFRKRKKSIFI